MRLLLIAAIVILVWQPPSLTFAQVGSYSVPAGPVVYRGTYRISAPPPPGQTADFIREGSIEFQLNINERGTGTGRYKATGFLHSNPRVSVAIEQGVCRITWIVLFPDNTSSTAGVSGRCSSSELVASGYALSADRYQLGLEVNATSVGPSLVQQLKAIPAPPKAIPESPSHLANAPAAQGAHPTTSTASTAAPPATPSNTRVALNESQDQDLLQLPRATASEAKLVEDSIVFDRRPFFPPDKRFDDRVPFGEARKQVIGSSKYILTSYTAKDKSRAWVRVLVVENSVRCIEYSFFGPDCYEIYRHKSNIGPDHVCVFVWNGTGWTLTDGATIAGTCPSGARQVYRQR